MLTKAMREKRLAFCKKYIHWTDNEWSAVLFSDETTFSQISTATPVVRRPKGQSPLNPRYTVKTVKHSSGFMAWECFAVGGRGALTILKKGERVNRQRYIGILEEELNQFMDLLGCTVFQ